MKKLLTALISAAFIAAPLAVISTPAAAANKPGATKKHKKAKTKKVRAAAGVQAQ